MAQRTDVQPESEKEKPSSSGATKGEAKQAGGTQEAPASQRTPAANDNLLGAKVPTLPPPSPTGPWRSYKEQVAAIAQRLVEAQRPIRILQSIRWDPSVEEAFRKSKYRELPKIGPDEYAHNDLGYDPRAKIEELEGIMRSAENELGRKDGIAQLLIATASEYRDVVRMLVARGTRDFYAYSRKLYGSPKDKFPDGKTTVRDFGFLLYDILTGIAGGDLGPHQPRDIEAPKAAAILQKRFADYFDGVEVQVQIDDSMLADAAAGIDYVKLRSGALFSQRDLDILEVHEGWVHVATSLNGQAQPVARWLAKGPPRTTAVQEGLAALLEVLTFRSYPRRARRLNDRILAVDKAEDGASFLDVFEWYRTEGYDEEECFANARRVFRGGPVEGGAPFTKDACYCKGIVLNYAFIRAAIQHNRTELIPFLFVGKVAHEDVPILHARVADGVVRPPKHVPPMFRDMNGLAIWMAYSSFFSRLGGNAVADYYGKLFRRGDG